MGEPFERKPEYWSEDLSDRQFEQAVTAALTSFGWKFEDNTQAFEHPDFYLLSRVHGKQVRTALELKDKRQAYRSRWAELAGLDEKDLLVVDEVAVRKLLAHAPRAVLLFWDRTRPDRPYVLFTIIDLLCVPKTRVQRPIRLHTGRLKAKWLLDARHGFSFSDLNHVFAALGNYLARDLRGDLLQLEAHGPFQNEKVETL